MYELYNAAASITKSTKDRFPSETEVLYIGTESVSADISLMLNGIPEGQTMSEQELTYFSEVLSDFLMEGTQGKHAAVFAVDIKTQFIKHTLDLLRSRKLQSNNGVLQMEGKILGGQSTLLSDESYQNSIEKLLREDGSPLLEKLYFDGLRPSELTVRDGDDITQYFNSAKSISAFVDVDDVPLSTANALTNASNSLSTSIIIAVVAGVGGLVLVYLVLFLQRHLKRQKENKKDKQTMKAVRAERENADRMIQRAIARQRQGSNNTSPEEWSEESSGSNNDAVNGTDTTNPSESAAPPIKGAGRNAATDVATTPGKGLYHPSAPPESFDKSDVEESEAEEPTPQPGIGQYFKAPSFSRLGEQGEIGRDIHADGEEGRANVSQVGETKALSTSLLPEDTSTLENSNSDTGKTLSSPCQAVPWKATSESGAPVKYGVGNSPAATALGRSKSFGEEATDDRKCKTGLGSFLADDAGKKGRAKGSSKSVQPSSSTRSVSSSRTKIAPITYSIGNYACATEPTKSSAKPINKKSFGRSKSFDETQASDSTTRKAGLRLLSPQRSARTKPLQSITEHGRPKDRQPPKPPARAASEPVHPLLNNAQPPKALAKASSVPVLSQQMLSPIKKKSPKVFGRSTSFGDSANSTARSPRRPRHPQASSKPPIQKNNPKRQSSLSAVSGQDKKTADSSKQAVSSLQFQALVSPRSRSKLSRSPTRSKAPPPRRKPPTRTQSEGGPKRAPARRKSPASSVEKKKTKTADKKQASLQYQGLVSPRSTSKSRTSSTKQSKAPPRRAAPTRTQSEGVLKKAPTRRKHPAPPVKKRSGPPPTRLTRAHSAD